MIFKHWIQWTLLLLVTLAASGCNLIEHIDMQADGTSTVHLKAIIDDRSYQVVQSGNASAFDPKTYPTWDVSRQTNDNNDHVFEATKKVQTDDIGSAVQAFITSCNCKGVSAFAVSPTVTKSSAGFLKSRWTVHADIPNPMGFGGMAASAFLQFHYEIKPPGTIVSSNGEQKSDGSISWNIPLSQPSAIDLSSDVTCIPLLPC